MGAVENIAGVEVHIDGEGPETVVMVHGYPDSHLLWDATVEALKARFRCVRFTLPGFEPGAPRRAYALDELVDRLRQIVDRTAQGKAILLLHDWGCVFGYHFAQKHPEKVSRLIGVDIGDAGSRAHRAEISLSAMAMIVAYQAWLGLAWRIGGRLGDGMARWMARLMRCPTPASSIRAEMGYPYWIMYTGTHGSYRALRPLDPPWPMLYLFGRRKPFMFHSRAWAQALAARPGSRVIEFDTGHWVMVGRRQEFNQAVSEWLAAGQR